MCCRLVRGPPQRLNPENDDLLEYFHNSRDGYRMLDPGRALGGAIMKDKSWFFAGYYPDVREVRPQSHFQHRQQHQDFLSSRTATTI